MSQHFLTDLLVLELGHRLAVSACGSVLSELGCEVVSVSSPGRHESDDLRAGKRSLQWHAPLAASADEALLLQLIARADVVLLSPDVDPAWPPAIASALQQARVHGPAIVCDVSAFGLPAERKADAGPLPLQPYSDGLLQAMSGILDTNGDQDKPPALCRAPIIEMASALYACSAVLAALLVQQRQGISQSVQTSMYNCAVSMLTTFLPKHFAGGKSPRIGNHHPSMSPWNAYRASDGWVLLCAGTNDQWRRVCELIGQPELAHDARYATTTLRVRAAAEVDAIVERWTAQHTVKDCAAQLNAVSISAGPILEMRDLLHEPGLVHRHMLQRLTSPAGNPVLVPGSALRGSVAQGRAASHIAAPDADRAWCQARAAGDRRNSNTPPQTQALTQPLAGIKVLEMGQFTTAPLVGRQLGALGADVVKLEPTGGEPGRSLPPHRDGRSYFFTLSNSDKRSMALDLRDEGRKPLLIELIRKADVLVENTKPGTLPRHGFTPEEILRINPDIIYCAISGYGEDSPYRGLGGMDTTIQGMSGIMALTRVNDVPYKTGISIADLHAGQFALVAVLGALACRERTGRGQYLDMSMQDAAAWVTRTAWNGLPESPQQLLRCRDGWLLAECPASRCDAALTAQLSELTRIEAAQTLAALTPSPITACPVHELGEVVNHPQTRIGGLIPSAMAPEQSAGGEPWPLLACPMQLSRTPAEVKRVIASLDDDAEAVIADWGLPWRAADYPPPRAAPAAPSH
jgi:crotonobetainyl-CoA:carnitine CoA-transferase CaiB-like acyl-CoA transferase